MKVESPLEPAHTQSNVLSFNKEAPRPHNNHGPSMFHPVIPCPKRLLWHKTNEQSWATENIYFYTVHQNFNWLNK
jgi:hypothetical protein